MIIGLEKENLIYDNKFQPYNFQKEELNSQKTLDFLPNQLELVSKPHHNISDLITEMYDILDNELVNFKIWPLSQPKLTDIEPDFSNFSLEQIQYRKYLLDNYNLNMLSTSGIHLNFSFENIKYPEFYFNMMQKIYVYGPIIMQFLSYTPVVNETTETLNNNFLKIGKNRGFENSMSLRNSTKYGYFNEHKFAIDYSSYESYRNSLDLLIQNKELLIEGEFYSKIRLKNPETNPYLELRFIDLNPFIRLGISIDTLNLIKIFLTYLTKIELKEFNINKCIENFDLIALNGRNKNLCINIDGEEKALKNVTNELFLAMINEATEKEQNILNFFLAQYNNNSQDIDVFINILDKENLSIEEFGNKYAFQKEKFVQENFYPNYDLELSTKILLKEAEKQKITYQIIDQSENFIALKKENQKEYIFQATKTNADSYANVLIMENKILTKKILSGNHINVPDGIILKKGDKFDYEEFVNTKIVIKPCNTNFGLGITILNPFSSQVEVDKALDLAFSYDNKIIVEKFFEGIEYRMLVINDEVVSIVNREPAYIIGDGENSIKELVNIENKNPLRNHGYITPGEYLQLGDFEINYLNIQNLTKDSVLPKNQKIYLRENSNVSTGGISKEVFDRIPLYFKEEARKAAKILDVKICGIDMIIDKDFENYTIIEANFNPAIQMHTFPFKGIGKNPANSILKLLFHEDEEENK